VDATRFCFKNPVFYAVKSTSTTRGFIVDATQKWFEIDFPESPYCPNSRKALKSSTQDLAGMPTTFRKAPDP